MFLPDIRGHHVLVRSDSRSMGSYINNQGGLVSKRLSMLANDLLVWAQNNLRLLNAMHVPGKMNHGADMLSRNNVSSEEWTLHLLTVQKIWEFCGRARVDLCTSGPVFRSMLSLQSLCYRRYSGGSGSNGIKLILIAFRRNQPWVSELFLLLVRRDLLSQVNGTIWHPRPKL